MKRIVTTPFMPVWMSWGMLLYQFTRMRLTIDCAYSPQSYHCVSNESGPDSANPLSPPCPARSTPCWPVPIEAIFPTSRMALFQLIPLAALACEGRYWNVPPFEASAGCDAAACDLAESSASAAATWRARALSSAPDLVAGV